MADLTAFDNAWTEEFGSTLSDTALFTNAAILYADDHDVSVMETPRPDFIADVARRRGWDPSRVEAILDPLTLTARDDYMRVPPGHGAPDVYPWRFGRRLSYLRRPFIQVGDDDDARLVYGTRQLYLSGQYLLELVSSGRLIARTQAMRELMGGFAERRSTTFVQEVAASCRAASLLAWTGVRKVGGERVGGRGADLGDIDVVAADLSQWRLWLIECKAVSAARTPWEIAHELHEFAAPNGHVARHARRVVWVRNHVHELLADLALVGADWSLTALIVTDVPVPAAYGVTTADLPIVEFRGLRDALRGGHGGGDGHKTECTKGATDARSVPCTERGRVSRICDRGGPPSASRGGTSSGVSR